MRRSRAHATYVDNTPIAIASAAMKTVRRVAVKSPSRSASGTGATAVSPLATGGGPLVEEHRRGAAGGADAFDYRRQVGVEAAEAGTRQRTERSHEARLERL